MLALVGSALLATTGCPSQSPTPSPIVAPPPVADTVERRVRAAALKSDLALRARSYVDTLTEVWQTRPEVGADLVRRLRERRDAGATSLASMLAPARRFDLHAVALQLAFQRADDAAIRRFAALLAPSTPRQRLLADELRARTLAWFGEHRAAAETLMAAAGRSPSDVPALTNAIWAQLAYLSVFELNALAREADTADAKAWATLARDVRAALAPSGQTRAWQAWRGRHPDHVAARAPPTSLRAPAWEPRSIALLVPVTGPLAALGEAIRDGFMAAYLHANADAQTVTVYDTGALTAPAAYRQAVADGAEAVVGPLDKAAVAAVFALQPRLPMVALNNPAPVQTAPRNVVRLALAVEDQAAAIATRLGRDGLRRVVVFGNATEWAARALARLQAMPDIDIATTATVTGSGDITTVAGNALAVSESKERHRELVALLRAELAFAPRRRDDIDAIVALVEANELLALKPALDFHFAGDVPVYAWSQAPRAAAVRLAGVHVCDIPWRLHPSPLRAEALAAFPASRADSPLFALGVDGYRLANQLSRLIAFGEPVAGSTGVLNLMADGGLRRQLAWAVAGADGLVPR